MASFMGVLLAAMEGSRDSAFCFVFPRKSGLAPLSAALYALGRYAVDFPRLAEQYARASFSDGLRVRLVPEDKVFVFAGVWPGLEKQFKLRLPDDKRNSVFNWPVSEILRIEPTTHRIPKGRETDISTARRQAPLSTLDRLIGTRTFGNPSLAVNYVLYLGGRTEVEDFLATHALSNSAQDVHSTLDQLVVPGQIAEGGEVRHQDHYQAAGEPLLAISSRVEHVSAACLLSPPRSKVVVVDGAKRLTDLAAFDTIANSQNLIIVAEPDEEEKLQQLYDRGCRFWRFSLADLEMGGTTPANGRFFNGVFRAARNEAGFRTEILPCGNFHLEQVAQSLSACEAALHESETDETQLVLRQVYSLLLHCAGLLAPPDDAERAYLMERARKVSELARDRMMWLAEPAAKALSDACEGIVQAISDPDLGAAKGAALKALLSDPDRQNMTQVAVLARSVPNRNSVARWLANEGFHYPVLLPAKVAENGFFERLICTSWPGSSSFGRVVRKFTAPEVCLVAYPFERQWLHWFGVKQRNTHTVPDLSSAEKSSLLGLSGEASWPAAPESAPVSDPFPPVKGQPHIDLEERMTRKGMIPVGAEGEERLPATLVSFLGDAYAFLTDTFRVPVITDLVSGVAGAEYEVPRRRLADISVGDILVFRETGRKDVIQALADAQLGPDASAIRERAARWHKALRESGLDEARLMTELEQVNCPRTLQTVRGWLADDSLIGPRTEADLVAIAYAVGSQKLLDQVPSIREAIVVLRAAHQRAGRRLSRILLDKLPERLEEMEEGRTRIEIDNATGAWIVQVESISDHVEMRPRSHINALLWDSEDLF